jgi:hypothetical protein
MMDLLIFVHEMFQPRFGFRAGDTAIPQVFDQPGVARSQPAKFCPRHSSLAQESFNPVDHHAFTPESGRIAMRE